MRFGRATNENGEDWRLRVEPMWLISTCGVILCAEILILFVYGFDPLLLVPGLAGVAALAHSVSLLRRVSRSTEEYAWDMSRQLGETYGALEAKLAESRSRLKLINNIAIGVSGGMSAHEIVEHALDLVSRQFPAFKVEHANVSLTGLLTVQYSVPPADQSAPVPGQIALSAAPAYLQELRAMTPILISDVTRDPRIGTLAAEFRERGIAARLDVPFQMPRDLLGVLSFSVPELRVWSEHEVESLREVASYLAIVASDALQRQELKEARAKRDELEAQLRQSQKLEAIGALAGGIAHDFNNILASIVNNIELCKMKLASDDALLEYVLEIEQASERATSLVRQILTFSRKQPQERRPTSVEPLIRESLKLLRATLPTCIELKITLSGKEPSISADASQLHQVLINLCTNAAYALKSSRGTIGISEDVVEVGERHDLLARGLKAGRYVRLAVSDDGCGIEQAAQSRIFEPFFTTKPPGEGSGLGLAVVHGIVTNHGGVIEVQSVPGRGSVFTIYLPLGSPNDHELRQDENESPRRGNGEWIMFVDDEEAIVNSSRRLLHRLGYTVVGFSSPFEALAAFRSSSERYRLVITDYSMPGMNGEELAHQIREIEPGMPMLLLSGYNSMITSDNAHGYGFNDVLEKPINSTRLAQAIHHLLRGMREAA